jgi:hypothetical protein
MNKEQVKAQLIVWWVLWAAFLSGIFVYYCFLGGSAPPPPGAEGGNAFTWLGCLVPLSLSTVIRWFVLPRLQNAQTALTVFILGIAFSESACFMGLFVFPVHKQELFLWSALGIFQFMPYFAGRYFSRDDH